MGFLSLYTGTYDLEVAPGYSVSLKKFLSQDDVASASEAMLKHARLDAGSTSADIDTTAYQYTVVLRAIVGWNLTDANDVVLPVNEDSLKLLPADIFNKLYAAVKAGSQDEVDPAKEATFPSGTTSVPTATD